MYNYGDEGLTGRIRSLTIYLASVRPGQQLRQAAPVGRRRSGRRREPLQESRKCGRKLDLRRKSASIVRTFSILPRNVRWRAIASVPLECGEGTDGHRA